METGVRTKQTKKDSIENMNQEAMEIFVKEGADAAAKHMLEKVNGNYNMLRSVYGWVTSYLIGYYINVNLFYLLFLYAEQDLAACGYFSFHTLYTNKLSSLSLFFCLQLFYMDHVVVVSTLGSTLTPTPWQ